MIDPIDPVRAKTGAGLLAEVPAVEPVQMQADRREAPPPPAQPAPAAEAAKAPQAPPREAMPRAGFEVHLDGATLRIYSELRDPETNRVLLRIPAGYKPKVEPPRDYTPTEFET